MISKEGYLAGRAELTKILEVIEWGYPDHELFPELAQDIFLGFDHEGNFGWIRVTTNTHPEIYYSFLGESFEEAMAAALLLVERD
jgi:hypothetical protein